MNALKMFSAPKNTRKYIARILKFKKIIRFRQDNASQKNTMANFPQIKNCEYLNIKFLSFIGHKIIFILNGD